MLDLTSDLMRGVMSVREQCPCGSGALYLACCMPLHHKQYVAVTAEALMRSRYSAFVFKLSEYLLESWHPSTRPCKDEVLFDSSETTKWLSLHLLKSEVMHPELAYVEFIAKYKVGGGRAQTLHEVSRFQREQGVWFYVDGTFPRQ